MEHQLLLDVLEALEDSGRIAIILFPYGAEMETPEEEKEETPYDEFREAELFEMGAGVGEDVILMDNPLQS